MDVKVSFFFFFLPEAFKVGTIHFRGTKGLSAELSPNSYTNGEPSEFLV